MRVIAGEYRSRVLETLEGEQTRPTTDKVRGALFSSIGQKIYDATVLDLFGGSGALSIESLSRGAKVAYCSDVNQAAVQVIEKNKANLHLDQLQIYHGSYQEALQIYASKQLKFDVVFLDPPYALTIYEELLRSLQTLDLLQSHALVVCESDGSVEMSEQIEQLTLTKSKKYGRIKITFYRNEDVS